MGVRLQFTKYTVWPGNGAILTQAISLKSYQIQNHQLVFFVLEITWKYIYFFSLCFFFTKNFLLTLNSSRKFKIFPRYELVLVSLHIYFEVVLIVPIQLGYRSKIFFVHRFVKQGKINILGVHFTIIFEILVTIVKFLDFKLFPATLVNIHTQTFLVVQFQLNYLL